MVSENVFLLHALLMGVFITFVYDLLRIFRRVIPHSLFFVSLEDLAFWIFCSVRVFLLLYYESDGTLRWFAILGALTGMLLYRKLFGALLVKYCSMALKKVLELFGKILKVLTKPLRILGKKAQNRAGKARGRVRLLKNRIKRAIKLRLTFFIKMLRINLKA